MDKELLHLQQYLHLHPVLEKDKKYRIAYVSLVKYICDKNAKRDKWNKGMMSLFKQCLMPNEDIIAVEIDAKNNIVFGGKNSRFLKYRFQKYRYMLLFDCLFSCAFDDKKKGKGVLDDVCRLFPRNAKKLSNMFDAFYDEDYAFVKNEAPTILNIYEIICNNRKFMLLPEKRIMITANMSAGKSTLLNALAGKKVNKTQNDTCTAKIHYLMNKAGEDRFSYELDYDLELNASQEVLMDDNADNSSLEIYVGTRFRSISEISNKVCFIDTPGVNSSQNKEHRELTDSTISDENCDLLIYLLNGENIGTDDDIKHLRFVAKNYHGEIVFLINKLDRFKKDVDSVPATLKKVAEDLTKIGYENPHVYPISAYAAHLAKMSMNGEELTEDEIDDLDFRKRKLSREEFQYHRYYDVEIPEIDENDELGVLLRNSGILSFEKIIY